MSKDESGFIVNAWKQMFGSLYSMSMYSVMCFFVRGGKGDARFSEMYVLVNICLSIAYLPLFNLLSTQRYITTIVLFYAVYRIFEIVVVHINIFFSLKPALTGFRRSVILLFHNYVEVLFWFASFYRLFPEYFTNNGSLPTKSIFGSLYFSLVTMSTLGYGDIVPVNQRGYVIVSIQTLVGIFMGIFLLARFISILPQRRTRDPEEREAIKKNQKEFALLVAEEVEKREKHEQE